MSDQTTTTEAPAKAPTGKGGGKRGGKGSSKPTAPAPTIADAPDALHGGPSKETLGDVFREAMRESAPQAGAGDAAPPPSDSQGDEGDADELDALEAALSGDVEGEPSGTDDGAGSEGDGSVDGGGSEPPQSLAELAERAGVDPTDLYGVEIPMAGEEAPVSIGDLKDAYMELTQGRADRESWEMQKAEEATQLAEARRQLAVLTSQIPESMRTPAMIEQAAAELEVVREREASALIERVPEWRDQTRYEADKAVMGDHIAKYGFSSEDLEAIVDHRLMAYVRDMALRESRLTKYLEQVQAKKRTKAARTQKQEASPSRSQSSSRGNSSGVREQTMRVADVLRGNTS